MLKFYDEFFDMKVKESGEFKTKFLKTIIKDNKLYKFVAFNDEEKLNSIKIDSLERDVLWFSYYKKLNDPTEYEITYSVKKISNKTGVEKQNIDRLVGCIKQLYDVCSFSYTYEEYMWEAYSNEDRGICLVFDINEYDFLYPVEYLEKKYVNFDKLLIQSYKNRDSKMNMMEYNGPMALYPWVIKNPYNGTMDSTKETEIRILYSPYDKSEFNNGIIAPKVKELHNFNGINVGYSDVGLSLSKIIIGNKCDEKLIQKINYLAEKKGIDIEKR